MRRAAAILISGLLALATALVPAHANRMGTPWMSVVSVDQTRLYGSPDRDNAIGPLARGAIVVVIGSQSDMTQTPDGWVPSSDVTEAIQAWIGEVSDSNATLYSKPNARSDTLRNANQG